MRPRNHGDKKIQEELLVYENNWLRRIAGVKRIDKRIMKKLKEEVGVKESLMKNLVKCRLNCTFPGISG